MLLLGRVWVLLLVGAAGSRMDVQPAVIGGRKAEVGRHRYMAALYHEKSFSNCGGSLITRRHVLTAKHCVSNSDWSKYEVVLGLYDRYQTSTSEQWIPVNTFIKHESIDAAIVILARNATLSENATIVELAPEPEPVGTWATAMGWGRTEHSTSGSSARFLQSVDLPIANSSLCNQPPYLMDVAEHEICCGDPTLRVYRGTCHGDSGSPLVVPANSTEDAEVTQIAITARGVSECPTHAVYGVYVSVPAIYNWVVCHSDMLDGRDFTNSPYVDCSVFVATTTPEHVNITSSQKPASTMPSCAWSVWPCEEHYFVLCVFIIAQLICRSTSFL